MKTRQALETKSLSLNQHPYAKGLTNLDEITKIKGFMKAVLLLEQWLHLLNLYWCDFDI